jgi:hypothetical protein
LLEGKDMTEYEASDRLLALSGNIIALNEAQASHIAIYLSVVFAFIAAAYVAGAKLTRFQAAIAYVLFSLFSTLEVFRIVSYGLGINRLVSMSVEWGSQTDALIMSPTIRLLVATALWGAGGIGALLFMWSVRNPRIK